MADGAAPAAAARGGGGGGWGGEGEWRVELEKLRTASREGIRQASKFAIAQQQHAETVVQVRRHTRRGETGSACWLARSLARCSDATAGLALPCVARVLRAGAAQMIVDRMEELPPRERVPMLFLIDAIVQVRGPHPRVQASRCHAHIYA